MKAVLVSRAGLFFAIMTCRPLTLAACLTACLATCAHPSPPAPSPTWQAPLCTARPFETAGPPTGATITCQGVSAVSYDDLREAAIFEAAKATLAARRSHFAIAGEERKAGAPALQCPPPGRDAELRSRLDKMTGATVETGANQAPCKPIPGSEGHVLALAVRFLRSAEAATVPGARSAADVLGMSTGTPAPRAPAQPEVDGGSDGASPRG
jgi:hypothetical protein